MQSDTVTTNNATNERMSEETRSSQRFHHDQPHQTVNESRSSKYTTGLLTTSGWIPQRNFSWRACHSRDILSESADAEVEELFQCYEERARLDVCAGSGGHTNGIIEENSVEADDPTGQYDADATAIAAKYLDYDSYFRHLGWSGCASLLQKEAAPIPLPTTPHQVVQMTTSVSAAAEAKVGAPVPQPSTDHNIQLSPFQPPSAFSRSTAVAQKSPTGDPSTDQKGKWQLIKGDTCHLRSGHPAPEKLILHIRNNETEQVEIYNFDEVQGNAIDWSDSNHLHSISVWREHVLRSHGFSMNKVVAWYHHEEDAWLLLFLEKVKAVVEAGRNIKAPGPAVITPAFNAFFRGLVLQDVHGKDLPPREAREEQSVRGKITRVNSKFWKLRDVIRKLLEGKRGGELYVPPITV